MDVLSFFRRLYSLDTLDTRLTISSRTPEKDTKGNAQPVPEGSLSSDGGRVSRSGQTKPQNGASPSRWQTPEFYLYYVVFIVVVPQMFKAVIEVSQELHPDYPRYAALLSPGWIPGRKVDNSDTQYASFRDNIPYMAALIMVHPALRHVYNRVFPSRDAKASSISQNGTTKGPATSWSSSVVADSRLEQRVSYDFYFALLFLAVLHGFSALKILTILYINFKIATRFPKSYVPAITWIFNIGILFANELCNGYPYTSIAEFVAPWSGSSDPSTTSAVAWGKWLDSHGGLMDRWQILFKVTILRLISFNLDYYWSLDTRAGSPLEKKQLDASSLSERDRVSIPAHSADYNFRNYLAYVLYSPLYLAGPILTFNEYISQIRYAPLSVTTTRTILYGIRFLLCLLCMELLLHYVYAVAIFKAPPPTPSWSAVYTPFGISMLAFFNLHIIWLKLLLPWRFFRLWALADGMDPVENMVRCMCNNYSALSFWRGWHRSYNRWIVRYIYVPLGGSRDQPKWRSALNFLIVFTFVALWHDINLRLLTWGWLISLFVLPEVLATLLFPKRKWSSRPNAYRVLCGVGAVVNILMMMAANLVGFAVGLDGMQGLVEGIVGSRNGALFLSLACAALFVGVQVMFEIRESEARQGIRLKY